MNKLLFLATVSFLACILSFHATANQDLSSKTVKKNPFKDITFHKSPNGMKYVLAPSSKAENIEISIHVGVGTQIENHKALQASHVLEHLLFRNKHFKNNQSYLQHIEEQGGSINAFVSYYLTAYEVSIPQNKDEWIIAKLNELLFNRKFDHESLKKAQKAVLLEIGEPSWLSGLLGFDLIGHLINSTKRPSYFEEHFGIRYTRFTADQNSLNVKKLKICDIEKHYQNYYYPENMTIYVSGNFRKSKMIKILQRHFGNNLIANTGRKTFGYHPNTKPIPYYRVYTHYDNIPASIEYGTKFHNVTAKERIALELFFEYLAKKITKDLRNAKGETYTPVVEIDSEKNFGVITVKFETSGKSLRLNIQYLQDLIEEKVFDAGLTKEEFRSAVDHYQKQYFSLAEADSTTRIAFAQYLDTFKKNYKTSASPYETLHSLTYSDLQNTVRKYFADENSYMVIDRKPFLFTHEMRFFWWISLFCSILFAGFILGLKSDGNSLHNVNINAAFKIRYSPFLFLECAFFYLITSMAMYVFYSPLDNWLQGHNWFYSMSMLPTYGANLLAIMAFVLVLCSWLAYYPRKIYFSETKIFIKSIAFFTKSYNRDQVKFVKTMTPFDLLRKPNFWLHWRFQYCGLTFLGQKGLLLQFKTGKTYFLGMKNPEKIACLLEPDSDSDSDSGEKPKQDQQRKPEQKIAEVIPLNSDQNKAA